MRYFLFFLLLFCCSNSYSQNILKEIRNNKVKKLNYFEKEESWILQAEFIADTGEVFLMPTTTERLPRYQQIGWLSFKHSEGSFQLAAYKNLDLKGEEYEFYAFIPFRDANAPEITYGGGRYIDVHIYPGDSLVEVDFNKAYNPYCVYSDDYSCPLTPEVNWIAIPVNAGEQLPLYKRKYRY